MKLDLIDLNLTQKPSEETLTSIKKINEELVNAKDYLKREAIISFNRGIDSSLSKETLTKAKEYIDQNKYSDALFLLSNASTIESPLFNLNYLIIAPILLIIISAFALKQSFGKKEKIEEDKKKIILEEWKE